MNYIKTTEKIVSDNYPYGFRLRTTKTDYLEFKKSHGFRHCSMTINPKTGRENKPKCGTYYDILLLGTDESTGYTKSQALGFYDHKETDQTIDFLKVKENFDLFTSEQMEYIYMKFLTHAKLDIYAQIQYCGSKLEDLKPLFNEAISLMVRGIKDHGRVNYFNQIKFDWLKIDNFKVARYQPFKVTSYGI